MIKGPFTRALLAALALCFANPALLRAQFTQGEYQRRRDALLARIPDGVLFVIGAREPVEDYLNFYQSPRFNYVTGFLEPDAALIALKGKGAGAVSPMLFVQPRDPAREVWTGSRLGVQAAQQRTGLNARETRELLPTLDSIAAAGNSFFVAGDFPGDGLGTDGMPLTGDQQLMLALQKRHPGLNIKVVNEPVDELRGRKSPAELGMIRRAVDITAMAQREAMKALEPGMNEFEIQALIDYTFRRNGADRPSFGTIIGSGPNSTTLHYNANDRFIQPGDIVVMDIGASYQGYAADVTRSIPASGTYSPEQRAIYRVVRDAQAAAERQAKLGAQASLMSDSASATIAAGLAQLGLIESPRATYDCVTGEQAARCPQFTLYYMHGLGHGIGLEVHDPEQFYYTQKIGPGSAFTIEPGIYVRANVLDVLPDTPANRAMAAKLRPAVEKYKNIGIRVEDDYVATESGVEWISRAPREMDEIEALMRTFNDGPAKRNAPLVESFRKP